MIVFRWLFFFFQAEDGIRDFCLSRGLGDVYKRQIAHGTSRSLIERAADVTLKERRTLVLVPRETPLSLVHLRNMTLAAEAGATVLPAAPGFYQRPKEIKQLVDFVVQRIVDHLGLDIKLIEPWQG